MEDLTMLRRMVDQLQRKAAHSELVAQKLRDARHQTDQLLEKFSRIHKYALDGFKLDSVEALCEIIAEGVVDIFQLSSGAVFAIDLLNRRLTRVSHCNFPGLPESLALPEAWLKNLSAWGVDPNTAVHASPPAEPPFSGLNLAHGLFMPVLDNERRPAWLFLGGVLEEERDFYEFDPKALLSPFMVFCQQMNAALNNIAALNLARRNAQAKSRFMANLSHEIRTPMNAVMGLAQMVADASDLEEAKKLAAQIDESSNHLMDLLNSVLDVSKIEEDKLALSSEPFNLRERIEALTAGVRVTAEAKGQDFAVTWRGFEDLEKRDFLGDVMRLSQVLLNMLTNAVKFTPEGGRVGLGVEEAGRDRERVLVRFSVADTGIGIAPEFISRLFNPFEQADSGISRKYGGTGLGLAISLHIVELMGGRIEVESSPGQGSTFSFHAWFGLAGRPAGAAKAAGEPNLPNLEGRRVLIVDDVALNRKIAAAFLNGSGAIIEQAENGREAFDRFLQSPTGHYHLMLMDIQMPIMDGLAAARAIRASGRADARGLVILAMTANAFKEDVDNALAAGMDGYISKPIKRPLFLSTIQQILQAKSYGKTQLPVDRPSQAPNT